MRFPRPMALMAAVLALLPATIAAPDAGLAESLSVLRAVGPEGRGNDAAGAAWRRVAAVQAGAIPQVLAAMDTANDYALNWLRSAVDAVVQRELAAGGSLPVGALQSFLKDTSHHPRARRLAFELIRRAKPDTARAMLPEFLEDPGVELRRDAVQQRINAAGVLAATDKPGAVSGFREALGHAREADQIDDIARRLKDLGDPVDLRKTFGWVTRWKLVGPFDNTGGAGFAKAYPPELAIDTTAELDGKKGKVRWGDHETRSDYGVVDLNGPLGTVKGAAAYALAEFWSKTERPAQVRLGCEVGWKVWVNGEFVFGRDEYHRATEIDQYRLPVTLKAGKNLILVKCLQNEQTEDWAVEWQFQLRVTDEQGTPITSAQ